MLDITDACKALGVSSNAGKNEIERRYSIILKKHKNATDQGETSDAEQEEFKKATEAYNVLMGYEVPSTAEPFKPNPLLKKMGIDEKKAQNFFYYYKFHILIAIAVLIIGYFTVMSFVNRVEPDFTTAFIGEIDYANTDLLYGQIKEAIPEIKEPGFDGAFITAKGNGPNDSTMVMKAIAVFSSGGADLYILDKVNFDKFAQQGGFISLDEFAAKAGIDLTKNKDFTAKVEDNSTEHLYGVDVSGSSAIKQAKISGKEMIAAIPVNTKKQELAAKLIEYLLK